ncbi:MAG: SDR family NAD(P)-dependent oxidoreductase, partial [Chloroflexi bacterium]|nr:SDR family NAD(P)-dependent oxidoreductase [Chloroflexota bacterium]
MGAFTGKVVIVTGGALGMGRDTAIEFGREGAAVTVADINDDAGKKTAWDIESAGGRG